MVPKILSKVPQLTMPCGLLCIYRFFKCVCFLSGKSIRSGILAFSLMAAFGSICKMNADTGGFLEGEKIHRTWERNR